MKKLVQHSIVNQFLKVANEVPVIMSDQSGSVSFRVDGTFDEAQQQTLFKGDVIIKEELLKNGKLNAKFNPGTESHNDVQCEEPKEFEEITPDL